MSKRPKPFLGHEMTRGDLRALASLIGFTTLPLGLPKKRIKNEEQIWCVTDAMFGLRPHAGEPFTAALRRIRGKIAAMPAEARTACRISGTAKLGYDHLKPRLVSNSDQVYAGSKERTPRVRKIKTRAPSVSTKTEFYKSWEWRTARMEVLKRHDRRCMCCGSTPDDLTIDGKPVRLVVDHIKPLSRYWNLRLDQSNLQILCDECNMGKGAWDETDHRSESERLIAEQLTYAVDGDVIRPSLPATPTPEQPAPQGEAA